MSIFFDTFKDRVKELFIVASKLDKPIDSSITWTAGLIKGRADFLDLQVHAAALAASIIITEKVVPPIIFAWDCLYDASRFIFKKEKDPKPKEEYYPYYLLNLFNSRESSSLMYSHLSECYERGNKYVTIYRSPLSNNPWPYSLGLGYRAKYLGLEYVVTPNAIMSDIDTICIQPCLEYLKEQISLDPNTFCLTNWYNEKWVSVGLCIFNMFKYRMIYKPYLNRMAWDTYRADSTFIQSIREKFPHIIHELDIRLFDKNMINAEKFSICTKRGNIADGTTAHYHAWKGEMAADMDGFLEYYSHILDELESKL